MLDQMRKNSRSLLISALFVIIIVTFIISFGPQSRGTTCDQVTGDEHYAARVAGETISKSDFRYGWLLSSGDRMPPKLARQAKINETVMDKLIERQLLAGFAEKLGFVVTDEDIEDQFVEGKIIALGSPITVSAMQK